MKAAQHPTALRNAQLLQQAGILTDVVEFEQPVRTSAEAAAAIGCSVAEIAKSIVFRGQASGAAVMVVASGDNRVSEAKVAVLVGEALGRADADFVRAANRSRGGKAFIVVPSTAKNDTISRIVPTLTPGTHVTTSKNDINYVVTEYGVAQLRGKSMKQRTLELIGIAHPNFRPELTEQAKRMRIL